MECITHPHPWILQKKAHQTRVGRIVVLMPTRVIAADNL